MAGFWSTAATHVSEVKGNFHPGGEQDWGLPPPLLCLLVASSLWPVEEVGPVL